MYLVDGNYMVTDNSKRTTEELWLKCFKDAYEITVEICDNNTIEVSWQAFYQDSF